MTSSNGNIFRVTGLLWGNSPITGEFSAQRQVTRSIDVFFDLRLNQQMSNQWRHRWFQMPIWCHCKAKTPWYLVIYCIHLRGECLPNNINGGLPLQSLLHMIDGSSQPNGLLLYIPNRLVVRLLALGPQHFSNEFASVVGYTSRCFASNYVPKVSIYLCINNLHVFRLVLISTCETMNHGNI